MQDSGFKMCGTSNQKRHDFGSLSMSRLARQEPIEFFRDLPDQNALQVAPRGCRQMQPINLSQHALNGQNGRMDSICNVDMHDDASSNKEPGTAI
jgi:hypothetical protein